MMRCLLSDKEVSVVRDYRAGTHVLVPVEMLQAIRSAWQEECDKYAHRHRGWEDLKCFYDLAALLDDAAQEDR